MLRFVVRDRLARWIRIPLWGDRERWGLRISEDDPCWREWERTYLQFYSANQRQGVGTLVNDAGYRVMSWIDLKDKCVLEIGPGDIRHMEFWNGRPKEYILADIQAGMLEQGARKLEQNGLKCSAILLARGQPLPLEKESVDVVVSFYSLEHIYPLGPYLDEIVRVLRPGGVLIGAIPAEGGLAWGVGRMLTSRRWFKQHTAIDPDKIICWEHPNFADSVIEELGGKFVPVRNDAWPFGWLPLLDTNLVVRFLYRKAEQVAQ